MIDVSQKQITGLASLLEERVGFRLDREHEGSLRAALAERVGPNADSVGIDAYLQLLRDDAGELRRFLPLVTVGKTSFFRDGGQFAALRMLLPALLSRSRSEGRRLAVWSAGCSSGEETYSLAAELLEAGAGQEELELLGTDVNAEAVGQALRGRYRLESSLSIPDGLFSRHFEREGDRFRAGPELRGAVRFQVHNLNEEGIPLPRSGSWDVIFCRNVLIYFTGAALRRVIDRIHDGMRPGGWLFLGYSESLFRVSEAFELRPVGDSFLYRRPDPTEVDVSTSSPVSSVEQSREHRTTIAAGGPSPGTPTRTLLPGTLPGTPQAERERQAPAELRPSARGMLSQAVERLREGSFGSARADLEVAIRAHPRDVGLCLTLAHVCVILREPQEANASYEEAISIDPLWAESHLFHGMHLMEQGELEQALSSLTRAVFLEPGLALAHYFIGRCQERRGDAAAARRAYRNAIGAAGREQASPGFLSYYPDLPDDGGTVARAAQLALAGL